MTQNKKKGVAKKALSISLVAAMLATSNVPVWASGFEAVNETSFATEAELLNETASSGQYTATLEFGEKADKGWGSAISVKSIKVTDAAGENVTSFSYAWMRNGVQISDAASQTDVTTIDPYTTTEADYDTNISLYIYDVKDTLNSKNNWSYISDSIYVGAKDISEDYKIAGITAPTYNGTEQRPTLSVVKKDDSKADIEFKIDCTGDLTNVTDEGVTVKAVPVDEKYTGTITDSYIMNAKAIAAADVTATMVTKAFPYTGNTIEIKKSDVSVLDAKTGADLSALIANDDAVTTTAKTVTTTGVANISLTKADSIKNFTGNATVRTDAFAVEARDLSTVNVVINNKAYTGQKVVLSQNDITFTDAAGEVLNLYNDVTVTIPDDAINYGTYTVSITPKTNNKNVVSATTATVTVFSEDISAAEFDTAGQAYAEKAEEYTGSQITKDLTKLTKVMLDGKQMDPADYEITFGSNVNAGDNAGVIYIKGKRTYEGSQAVINFNINPAKVSAATVSTADYVILDTAKTKASEYADEFALVVKAKNAANPAQEFTLNPSDYEVIYDFVTVNKADAYVKATITLKNKNYTISGGATNITKQVRIANQVIKDADIKLAQTSYVYTGTAIEPEYSVVVNGKTLEKNQYKVVSINNSVAVGTATLTITGDGKEYDNKINAKVTYTITPANAEDIVVEIPGTYVYNAGKPVNPDFAQNENTVKLNGNDVKDQFDITFGANNTVGKEAGTVILTPKKGNQNFTDTKTATFEIVAKALKGGTLTKYNASNLIDKTSVFDYDGTAHTYTKVVYTPLETGLKEGTDYEIIYVDNVYGKNVANTQKGAILVVAKGTYAGNYTGNTSTNGVYVTADGEKITNVILAEQFTINQKEFAASNVAVSNATYAGGIAVAPNVVVTVNGAALVEGKDYKLTYPANTDLVNATKTNSLKVTVVPVNGYKAAAGANLTFNWGIDAFDLNKAEVTVDGGNVTVKCGKVELSPSDYDVAKDENGNLVIKPAVNNSNLIGQKVISDVTPEKTTLKVTDRTTSTVSLAWDKVDGAEGYTIWFRSEYDTQVSRKIINGGDITSWTQNGLQPGTKYFYTIRAWVKTADGYVFGEQSPVQRGTTKPIAAVVKSVSATNGYIKVALAGKAAGAEMYSMCYSKSVNFNDFKVGIRTSYTNRTFSKAVSAGTYYVRVKSYRDLGNNKRVYGAWSNAVKVVVK